MKKYLLAVIFIILSFHQLGFCAEVEYSNHHSGDSSYINFYSHSKFLNFWDDFRRAVKLRDIDKVVKMTNFPFVDYYNKGHYRKTLTANDEVEFRELYTTIFKPSVVEICTYDYPITCEEVQTSDDLPGDCFTPEEKMFNPEYFFIICKDSDRNLMFGKVGGVYKLIGIKFL